MSPQFLKNGSNKIMKTMRYQKKTIYWTLIFLGIVSSYPDSKCFGCIRMVRVSIIDSAGDVGPDSSIAVDSNNKVHISYVDNVNADLKYAINASGSWVVSMIDGAEGAVGIHSSIGIDANNNVHISYYDVTNGHLKYATDPSGSWEISTIDSTGDVGKYTSIAIDSNNKIHISYCDYTNFDLKYATNASGSWETFIVDSTGDVGKYTSIGVDSNDNVHISYIDNTNWYLKYATNASGLWTTFIVDSSMGFGISMAIDSNNKVHISYPAPTSSALKYATNASGSWVTSTIDSEGMVGDYSSIAIDSYDKIHISYFDNTNADLKYATNASGAWITSTLDSVGIVGGFTSIAVDSNDKVHISYYDGTNGDLKYAMNASTVIDPTYEWHTFYGGSNYDFSYSTITTDRSGNVYVTGYSVAMWEGPAGQSPLHAYSGNNDFFVLKLDSNGSYQWHTFYGSTIGIDIGNGIATDSSGNVYITGGSWGTWNGPAGESPFHAYSGGNDIFVLKLDSTGSYQWHTFYGSSDSDAGYTLAMDGGGNVYVSGYGYGLWNGPDGQSPLHAYSGNADIFVLKLDSTGSYQWHTFYGAIDSDEGYALAMDGGGNVYVTGGSIENWNGPGGENPLHAYSGSYDVFVLKLDSSGSYQWHTFYGASSTEMGGGIVTDGRGGIYVTGFSSATWNGPGEQSPLHAHSSPGYYDIFVLKLDSIGAYQWHTFYGSSDNDYGLGIGTDGRGNVYVSGYGYGMWNGPDGQSPLHAYSGNADIFVLKLDSSGAYRWHTLYGSSSPDLSFGIASGGAGNVYVTGFSSATWNGPSGESPLHAHSSPGYYDFFVLKLSHAPSGSDFDGDGATDVAAFHLPSDQFFTDYTGNMGQYGWGGSNSYPLVWDYDGDGKTDVSIYHIPTNQWFVKGVPGDNLGAFGWGGDESVPVPGDYNGDGVIERAFYHWPTNRWFIEWPDHSVTSYDFGWNGAECIPVPGDYDGNGTTVMMLYHIPSNQWFRYGVGNLGQYGWGGADCIPVPGDYLGNGQTQIAVYHIPTNQWFVKGYPGDNMGQYGWGNLASFPIPGDYDGNGVMERAFYRPSENRWFIDGEPDFVWGWDTSNFMPITSQITIYNWFRFMLGMFQ